MISSFREKYNQPIYNVSKIDNIRFYSVSENLNVPSVTSILRLTNPKQPINFSLNHKTDSMEIGNYMHKYLEHYVSKNDGFHCDTKNYVIAKKLAQIIIDNFINIIDGIIIFFSKRTNHIYLLRIDKIFSRSDLI